MTSVLGFGLIWLTESAGINLTWLNGVMLAMFIFGGFMFFYAGAQILIDVTIGARMYLVLFAAMLVIGGLMTVFGLG